MDARPRYPSYQLLAPRVERVAAAARVFEEDYGRPPSTAEYQRLTTAEARRRGGRWPATTWCSRQRTVSLLWALGRPETRASVEAAHHEAVDSTIGWVERHAAFTRTGHGGTAQVDTTGLVCGVRPPGVQIREPGPAHPRRGREQGLRR